MLRLGRKVIDTLPVVILGVHLLFLNCKVTPIFLVRYVWESNKLTIMVLQ